MSVTEPAGREELKQKAQMFAMFARFGESISRKLERQAAALGEIAAEMREGLGRIGKELSAGPAAEHGGEPRAGDPATAASGETVGGTEEAGDEAGQAGGASAVDHLAPGAAATDPVTKKWYDELAHFQRIEAELVKDERYFGKYVAIKDRQIVDIDADDRRLTDRIDEKFPDDPVLIAKVGGPVPEGELSSPEFLP